MRFPSRNAACDAVVQQAIAHGEFIRAAEELVRGYQHAIVRCCIDCIGEPADGEDVAQDIFLGAYTSMARFRQEASVYTWLCAIVQNHIYKWLRDHLRRQRLFPPIRRRHDGPAPGPGEEPEEFMRQSRHGRDRRYAAPEPEEDPEELIKQVMDGLKKLGKAEQTLLRMRYTADIPVVDMAKILGLSRRTVERHLAHALQVHRQAVREVSNNERE